VENASVEEEAGNKLIMIIEIGNTLRTLCGSYYESYFIIK